MRKRRAKLNYRRIVLRLPDLDHSKMAVLNSLTSPGSRRVYRRYERDGLYFVAVRLIIAGEIAAFEFGLDKRGFCFSYTSSGGGVHWC